MILVAGGTGDLGGRVVRLLRGQGHHVRCLARAETQEPALGQLGAAVVRGDLTEPRTLPPACKAQTPLMQVSLRWDASLKALATPPSVRPDAFQETHQLDEGSNSPKAWDWQRLSSTPGDDRERVGLGAQS